MIVEMRFDLPEEEELFQEALQGHAWKRVVEDLNEQLRVQLKYDELLPNQREALQKVRDGLFELLQSEGVRLG